MTEGAGKGVCVIADALERCETGLRLSRSRGRCLFVCQGSFFLRVLASFGPFRSYDCLQLCRTNVVSYQGSED